MSICLSCVAFKKQTTVCTCDALAEVPLYKKVEDHIRRIAREHDEEYKKSIPEIAAQSNSTEKIGRKAHAEMRDDLKQIYAAEHSKKGRELGEE